MMYHTHVKIIIFCASWLKKYVIIQQKILFPSINYSENKKSGVFKEFYNNNKVKTTGQFSSNNKIGLWKQYYENSILKTVLLYIESKDTTELVYKKEYHENGNLKACILPIDLSTNNSNLEYKIGYTYQLYIKLKYSIHEKCKISGELFDYSSNQDVKLCNSKDPLILICEFTPCSKGDHFIKGEIFEYEGIKDDEKYCGVTMFDFKYKASKQSN